jgi:hypothetical protein
MEFRIADTFTNSLANSLARLTGDEQKVVKTSAFDLQTGARVKSCGNSLPASCSGGSYRHLIGGSSGLSEPVLEDASLQYQHHQILAAIQ